MFSPVKMKDENRKQFSLAWYFLRLLNMKSYLILFFNFIFYAYKYGSSACKARPLSAFLFMCVYFHSRDVIPRLNECNSLTGASQQGNRLKPARQLASGGLCCTKAFLDSNLSMFRASGACPALCQAEMAAKGATNQSFVPCTLWSRRQHKMLQCNKHYGL